jgi:ribonuclease HI
MNIIITTDGGASPSSGPLCQYAAILQAGQHKRIVRGQEPGTNNVGELLAVIRSLEALKGSGHTVTIRVDSNYVLNGITKWIPGWKNRGWRKADGRPVANAEYWQRLDELVHNGNKIRFDKVTAHAGDSLNDLCDAIVQEVRLYDGDLARCSITEADIK